MQPYVLCSQQPKSLATENCDSVANFFLQIFHPCNEVCPLVNYKNLRHQPTKLNFFHVQLLVRNLKFPKENAKCKAGAEHGTRMTRLVQFEIHTWHKYLVGFEQLQFCLRRKARHLFFNLLPKVPPLLWQKKYQSIRHNPHSLNKFYKFFTLRNQCLWIRVRQNQPFKVRMNHFDSAYKSMCLHLTHTGSSQETCVSYTDIFLKHQ